MRPQTVRRAKRKKARVAHAGPHAPAPAQQVAASAPDPGVWDANAGMYTYPNQRLMNDARLDPIMKATQRFWSTRGIPAGETPPQVYAAGDLGQSVVGRAHSPGFGHATGNIMLEDDWVGAQLAQLAAKRWWKRKAALQNIYATLAHEYGHVGGLQHNEEGLMTGGEGHGAVPGDWRLLAREMNLLPKKRKR